MDPRLENALTQIRPALQADGGDIEIVQIRPDGVLELRWLGACRACPLTQMTLRAGVERVVLNEMPEIKRVEAVR